MKQLDDMLKDSLLRALDEARHDDLLLMLANYLRARQEVVSQHARASLPVDVRQCRPLAANTLKSSEVEAFDLRDTGWYVIAVEDCRIVGAEPFPYTVDDPNLGDRVQDYVRSVGKYYGDAPALYGVFHSGGKLSDYQPLHEFRPERRTS